MYIVCFTIEMIHAQDHCDLLILLTHAYSQLHLIDGIIDYRVLWVFLRTMNNS